MEEKDQEKPAHQDTKDFTQWGWKHPYVIYIGLVLGLFFFLILMAYLAIQNDWLPTR